VGREGTLAQTLGSDEAPHDRFAGSEMSKILTSPLTVSRALTRIRPSLLTQLLCERSPVSTVPSSVGAALRMVLTSRYQFVRSSRMCRAAVKGCDCVNEESVSGLNVAHYKWCDRISDIEDLDDSRSRVGLIQQTIRHSQLMDKREPATCGADLTE
jgi:hypothetical protein